MKRTASSNPTLFALSQHKLPWTQMPAPIPANPHLPYFPYDAQQICRLNRNVRLGAPCHENAAKVPGSNQYREISPIKPDSLTQHHIDHRARDRFNTEFQSILNRNTDLPRESIELFSARAAEFFQFIKNRNPASDPEIVLKSNNKKLTHLLNEFAKEQNPVFLDITKRAIALYQGNFQPRNQRYIPADVDKPSIKQLISTKVRESLKLATKATRNYQTALRKASQTLSLRTESPKSLTELLALDPAAFNAIRKELIDIADLDSAISALKKSLSMFPLPSGELTQAPSPETTAMRARKRLGARTAPENANRPKPATGSAAIRQPSRSPLIPALESAKSMADHLCRFMRNMNAINPTAILTGSNTEEINNWITKFCLTDPDNSLGAFDRRYQLTQTGVKLFRETHKTWNGPHPRKYTQYIPAKDDVQLIEEFDPSKEVLKDGLSFGKEPSSATTLSHRSYLRELSELLGKYTESHRRLAGASAPESAADVLLPGSLKELLALNLDARQTGSLIEQAGGKSHHKNAFRRLRSTLSENVQNGGEPPVAPRGNEQPREAAHEVHNQRANPQQDMQILG